MNEERPLLELKEVGKVYSSTDGDGRLEVLNNISLTLKGGDSASIVGPSGSGKSTLLNIMGGLDIPSSGDVILEGDRLGGLSDADIAAVRNRKIGFVFQSHHLLPQCSVLENVLVPCLAAGAASGEQIDRAGSLLERVGLKERTGHRPGQLSGGECQRVAVVRALINQPRLLLADEPTGALDQKNTDGLADLLLELNQENNVALVLVTHSMDLANRMKQVYRLNDGGLTGA
ncbi:MAG: ABC transporter ATP-binding protein [Verrucomicrobiota bacterium]